MKKFFLIYTLLLLVSSVGYAQVDDDFSDGDFSNNPNWIGTSDLFFVNNWKQLQSCASSAVDAYLSTVSMVNYNATWNCSVRISTRPSAYNYSRFYLCAENADPTTGSALYVQVGGKKRNISLCIKNNNTLTVLAETEEQIVNEDDNRVELSVTYSSAGYILSYKMGNDDFKTINASVQDRINSNYCSVYYSCSSKKGSEYYFDNIKIVGEVKNVETQPVHEDTDTIDQSDTDTIGTEQNIAKLSLRATNFSPNGDGFEDECLIDYILPSDGYTATMQVFTPSGKRIAAIAENQLLQQSGTISWNGTNNSGSTVQIGLYVINCELINVSTGHSFKKLLIVSVSAR